MKKIVVSSLAFDTNIEDMETISKQHNYTVEFSSGLPFREEMASFFLKTPINKFIHNYFPAPKIPFVINLGSENKDIRDKSIAHCVQGIKLASQTDNKFYSAHAGFCIDPKPQDLGNKFEQNNKLNRQKTWDIFIESCTEVLKEARKHHVHFLIENNVLAKFNIREDVKNPFLCADPNEIKDLYNTFEDKYFGILLDTAHLKVSANSLGFDKFEAIEKISGCIKYIHHSDNNGLKDSNDPIFENYWFLPLMRQFEDCIHVLEVKNQSTNEIERQIKLLEDHLR